MNSNTISSQAPYEQVEESHQFVSIQTLKNPFLNDDFPEREERKIHQIPDQLPANQQSEPKFSSKFLDELDNSFLPSEHEPLPEVENFKSQLIGIEKRHDFTARDQVPKLDEGEINQGFAKLEKGVSELSSKRAPIRELIHKDVQSQAIRDKFQELEKASAHTKTVQRAMIQRDQQIGQRENFYLTNSQKISSEGFKEEIQTPSLEQERHPFYLKEISSSQFSSQKIKFFSKNTSRSNVTKEIKIVNKDKTIHEIGDQDISEWRQEEEEPSIEIDQSLSSPSYIEMTQTPTCQAKQQLYQQNQQSQIDQNLEEEEEGEVTEVERSERYLTQEDRSFRLNQAAVGDVSSRFNTGPEDTYQPWEKPDYQTDFIPETDKEPPKSPQSKGINFSKKKVSQPINRKYEVIFNAKANSSDALPTILRQDVDSQKRFQQLANKIDKEDRSHTIVDLMETRTDRSQNMSQNTPREAQRRKDQLKQVEFFKQKKPRPSTKPQRSRGMISNESSNTMNFLNADLNELMVKDQKKMINAKNLRSQSSTGVDIKKMITPKILKEQQKTMPFKVLTGIRSSASPTVQPKFPLKLAQTSKPVKKGFDRNESLPLKKYTFSRDLNSHPFLTNDIRPESKNSTQNSKFSNIIKNQQQLVSSFIKNRHTPVGEGEESKEADNEMEQDFIKQAKLKVQELRQRHRDQILKTQQKNRVYGRPVSTGIQSPSQLSQYQGMRPGSQIFGIHGMEDPRWQQLMSVLESEPQLLVQMLPSPKQSQTPANEMQVQKSLKQVKQTNSRKASKERNIKSGKSSGNHSKKSSSQQRLNSIIQKATYKIKGKNIPQLAEFCNCGAFQGHHIHSNLSNEMNEIEEQNRSGGHFLPKMRSDNPQYFESRGTFSLANLQYIPEEDKPEEFGEDAISTPLKFRSNKRPGTAAVRYKQLNKAGSLTFLKNSQGSTYHLNQSRGTKADRSDFTLMDFQGGAQNVNSTHQILRNEEAPLTNITITKEGTQAGYVTAGFASNLSEREQQQNHFLNAKMSDVSFNPLALQSAEFPSPDQQVKKRKKQQAKRLRPQSQQVSGQKRPKEERIQDESNQDNRKIQKLKLIQQIMAQQPKLFESNQEQKQRIGDRQKQLKSQNQVIKKRIKSKDKLLPTQKIENLFETQKFKQGMQQVLERTKLVQQNLINKDLSNVQRSREDKFYLKEMSKNIFSETNKYNHSVSNHSKRSQNRSLNRSSNQEKEDEILKGRSASANLEQELFNKNRLKKEEETPNFNHKQRHTPALNSRPINTIKPEEVRPISVGEPSQKSIQVQKFTADLSLTNFSEFTGKFEDEKQKKEQSFTSPNTQQRSFSYMQQPKLKQEAEDKKQWLKPFMREVVDPETGQVYLLDLETGEFRKAPKQKGFPLSGRQSQPPGFKQHENSSFYEGTAFYHESLSASGIHYRRGYQSMQSDVTSEQQKAQLVNKSSIEMYCRLSHRSQESQEGVSLEHQYKTLKQNEQLEAERRKKGIEDAMRQKIRQQVKESKDEKEEEHDWATTQLFQEAKQEYQEELLGETRSLTTVPYLNAQIYTEAELRYLSRQLRLMGDLSLIDKDKALFTLEFLMMQIGLLPLYKKVERAYQIVQERLESLRQEEGCLSPRDSQNVRQRISELRKLINRSIMIYDTQHQMKRILKKIFQFESMKFRKDDSSDLKAQIVRLVRRLGQEQKFMQKRLKYQGLLIEEYIEQ